MLIISPQCYVGYCHIQAGGTMPSKWWSGQTTSSVVLAKWSLNGNRKQLSPIWAQISSPIQFAAAAPRCSHTTNTLFLSFHFKESVLQYCDHATRWWHDWIVWDELTVLTECVWLEELVLGPPEKVDKCEVWLSYSGFWLCFCSMSSLWAGYEWFCCSGLGLLG